MTHTIAWAITENDVLAACLSEQLRQSSDCEVGVATPGRWLAGEVLAERPQQLFFDLRAEAPYARELWEDLPKARARTRHLAGSSLQCFAVIDKGYPIEFAKQADRHLAGHLIWPLQDAAVRSAVQVAERDVTRRETHLDFESRVVRSENHVFCTYTPALFPLLDNLQRAARHDFTILIVGETGTGKTTLAGMIHELSPRRVQRFLNVASGALPGDLIDSELFGHVRGAFTGADRDKVGKFEAAGEGTILLDEIDVLGMLQQAKLLRVLETGEFEPIGSNETRRARCRTIVASNVSLESLMAEQRFRSDLYYRLNQVKFEIPPLRERPRDILPLAVDFIDECRREHGLPADFVHPDLLAILKAYRWPGNIRELRNEVRRCTLFHQDGVVTPGSLSLAVLRDSEVQRPCEGIECARSALAQDVALTEREAIEQMLRAQNFNRAATARALGISRVTLYNKIRKYRIPLDASEDQA